MKPSRSTFSRNLVHLGVDMEWRRFSFEQWEEFGRILPETLKWISIDRYSQILPIRELDRKFIEETLGNGIRARFYEGYFYGSSKDVRYLSHN